MRLALLVAVSLGAVLTMAAAKPESHLVTIQQMQFNPQQLSVRAGDTIEWKNEDIYSHTVTATDGSFDSGLIDRGGSWKMTVTRPGTVTYHCRPHPNMTAAIVVTGAGSQPTQGHLLIGWEPPHAPQEIHPILVNFTAALLPLALLSDVLGRIVHRPSLHHAAVWMMLYEAVITPFTAAAGWWWKSTAGATLPPTLIAIHQALGTVAAVLFLALGAWRWTFYKRDVPPSSAYLAAALLAVLALIYQGSIGGRMLFGP